MKISKTACIGLASLALWLSVYCSGVTAKESQREAEKASSNPKLVYVKGGAFLMGDVMGDGDRAMLAEIPVHEVELGSFLLSPHEVTVSEFRRFVEETGFKTVAEKDRDPKDAEEATKQGKTRNPNWKAPGFEQTGRHAVVWIAWEDAVVYCNWLSKKHGLAVAYNEPTGKLLDKDGKVTTDVRQVEGFRLPTEAEWEYAARERGKKVRFGNGKNVALSDEINFDARKAEKKYTVKGRYREATTPVGSFAPNALGLYDMSGNVWEWCTDSGVEYTSEKVRNPYALHKGGHMARGGTWDSSAAGCRVTRRINWWLNAMCSATGFRIARTTD
ncbi:MAG: formylglycine-generating enzyme family protein [Planctomycetota bacterium]|jgi:formylglycine-generating enzyme required for sulfatase activity